MACTEKGEYLGAAAAMVMNVASRGNTTRIPKRIIFDDGD